MHAMEHETTTEILRDPRELERLRPEWDDLLANGSSDSPFLTWEWLDPWWRHLGQRRRLAMTLVRAQGRLVGAAPWCLAPPSPRLLLPFSRLEFLGSGSVGSDYLDIVLRRGFERPALESIERHLVGHPRVLHLAGLPQGGTAVQELATRLSRRGWSVERRDQGPCPFISLEGLTWDGYLAQCSASQRYAFRRKQRRLHSCFRVEFEPIASEPERAEALAVLIDLHNRRWRGRGGSDGLHRPELHAFHDEASRNALSRGWLRLYVLRLNGRSVAALYGLLYRNVFHFYQSGFDPAFGKWSVGLVTLGWAIQRAIDDGASEFDFLHGDEEYKGHWTRSWRGLERLELYPPRIFGVACRKIAETSRAARALVRRLVPAGSPSC
jgi:CelD/BcsL family acetyltransferase involved in cellulose biosynthesis